MGWRYFATEELYLEPQVQMWYGHVFDADYHTSTGIKVENDSVDSLVGRVGVKMGYKDSQGRGGVFLKPLFCMTGKGMPSSVTARAPMFPERLRNRLAVHGMNMV